MRHQIHTEITIEAAPEEVWSVLTDLDRYQEWNPFLVSAEGDVAVGQRLVNRLQPPGGRAQTFRPTITVVEPNRAFEWLGRLGLPGIFDGRHRFDLEPTDDGGTRLVHQEHFRGLLVPFMRRMLDGSTREGFELMNEALKSTVESSARADR